MPVEILGFAVVAHNIDNSLQVLRHGLLGNVASASFPCCRHTLLRHDRLFANRTTVVETCKLAEAMGVNGVTAGEILRGLPGGKHIFATHGTIVLVLVLETIVREKDVYGNAHTAFVAMPKGFGAAHATKSALVAVEGFLGLCHP